MQQFIGNLLIIERDGKGSHNNYAAENIKNILIIDCSFNHYKPELMFALG